MNFLKRKLFQEGGAANVDERYFFIDKTTGVKEYIDPIKLYNNLSRSDAFTITSFIQNPDVTYSPGTQDIFRRLVSEKKSGPSTVDPNLFEFGQALPDYLTAKAGFRDIAGGVGQGMVGAIESGINLGKNLFRGLGEGGAKRLEEGFVPTDILPGGIGSERMPFRTDTMTGAASDTDPLGVYDMGGTLRQGIPQERLIATLSQARVGDVITDFSEEIAEINEQPIEPAPEEISDVLEPNITAGLPEQLPTLVPTTRSETLGQAYAPGTVGNEELEARKLAYEKSLIGRDEFGNLLPEGRLEQDDEITKAIKELQPAELKVDVNKTEADSLLETQNKFDGRFDPPKITLDKVDTTITTKDRDTKTIPVIKETSGIFGSDRFLDFIRNVGGELVRTGQMGEGLASGAAKASEERAARELLEKQEEKKYQRDLSLALAIEAAKNAGKDPFTVSEVDTITKQETTLAENIEGFNKSSTTLSNLNYIIQTLEAGGATGLKGFFGEYADMIEAAIKSDTGKDFDELQPRTRVNSILNVIRQANVREILGESGKTISNLDRQIVNEVFGDIKLGTPAAVSLKKLEDSRNNIINGMMEQQNKVIIAKGFFDKVGYESDVYNINQPIIDLIKSFSFADATSYRTDQNIQDQSITDIDYRTPGT